MKKTALIFVLLMLCGVLISCSTSNNDLETLQAGDSGTTQESSDSVLETAQKTAVRDLETTQEIDVSDWTVDQEITIDALTVSAPNEWEKTDGESDEVTTWVVYRYLTNDEDTERYKAGDGSPIFFEIVHFFLEATYENGDAVDLAIVPNSMKKETIEDFVFSTFIEEVDTKEEITQHGDIGYFFEGTNFIGQTAVVYAFVDGDEVYCIACASDPEYDEARENIWSQILESIKYESQTEEPQIDTEKFGDMLDAYQGEWKDIREGPWTIIISGENVNYICTEDGEVTDIKTYYFDIDENGRLLVIRGERFNPYYAAIDDEGNLTFTDTEHEKLILTYERISDNTTVPELVKKEYKVPPAIGMTASEVYASTWGSPKKINKRETAYGVHEQWVYDKGYIYFEDGIVTSIQKSY